MRLLMQIDGFCAQSTAGEGETDVVIEHFSLSIQHDDEDENGKGRARLQVSKRADEASVHLLGLSVSRRPVSELRILLDIEDADLATRIILREATIDEFVTVNMPGSAILDESLSIAAQSIVYERGAQRFDERRVNT